MASDEMQLARACRILLGLAGLDDDTLWTEHGPSRRASWLKGYLHRDDGKIDSHRRVSARPLAAIQALSRREKTMLLVAFDLWNGSGAVALAQVLGLPPRLVRAVAGVMEAGASDDPEALQHWIVRWTHPPTVFEN